MEMERQKGISGAALKWFAVITMLIDHFAVVFFSTWYWPARLAAGVRPMITDGARALYWILRGVGRFSFPIYCFLLVEGYFHTRNVKKYLGRLLFFGLISEIPFDLAFDRAWFVWQSQNVYFTLFLGLLAVSLFDSFRRMAAEESSRWLRGGYRLLGLLCVFHTGVAYCLYFGSLSVIPLSAIAVWGYLEPVVAVLCSTLILKEPLSAAGWIGAALIVGAAVVSELPERSRPVPGTSA